MERVGVTLSAILAPCPLCGAQPLTPCVNGSRELRYTHAERN
jgi:hypothetical protein